MKRLTKRTFISKEKQELVMFTQKGHIDTTPAEMTPENIQKVLKKLAEYEDFEEIFHEKMTGTAYEFLNNKKEFEKWLDRNKWVAKKCYNLVKAKEKGLLIQLPVPIGTTVYEFEPLNKEPKKYTKRTVIKYTIYDDSIWFNFEDEFMKDVKNFDKTIFLTRKETEQKLKEMENNSHDA